MIREDAFVLHRPGGLFVRGESYAEGEPKSTVIICHGFKGFAHWAFFPHLAREIARAGMRALTFDFSGSGIGADRETFTEPDAFRNNTFTHELADLDAVIQEARLRGWLTGRYGLLGHSRGGGIAILHTAINEDVAALVTWAAIAHPLRWPPDAVDEWRRRGYVEIVNSRTGQVMQLGTAILDDVQEHELTSLSIANAARRITQPWLIVHGAKDETVPREEAERLHEMSRASSTVRIIEGANHAFDAKHPLTETPAALEEAVRATVDFFLKHLQHGDAKAAHASAR